MANARRYDVTPEMMDAGNAELERHYLGDGKYDLSDGKLEGIFRAMIDAAPIAWLTPTFERRFPAPPNFHTRENALLKSLLSHKQAEQ